MADMHPRSKHTEEEEDSEEGEDDARNHARELKLLRREVSELRMRLHDPNDLAAQRQRTAHAETLPLFATPHALWAGPYTSSFLILFILT